MRTIHKMDALKWLDSQPVLEGCSIITSMPDYSEFPTLSLEGWKNWFLEACNLIFSRCPQQGVVIFYQRDSKRDGIWVDKGYLCQKSADENEYQQLWHKIICRAPPGQITFGRPAYSHMICFSKEIRVPLEKSSSDVILSPGKTTWTRGMGVDACLVACRFIIQNTHTHTIVDPFCGHGTVLAVANQLGLNAVGVELSRKRAEKAEKLVL